MRQVAVQKKLLVEAFFSGGNPADHALVNLQRQNANNGYKHLLELHNFYKLNVSYVTTYIIKSDYYSVKDKFTRASGNNRGDEKKSLC